MVDYAHVVRSDIISHFTCVRFLARFFSVPSADTQGRCKFSLRNVPFSHIVVVLLLQHCCASDFSDFFCCCFCWKGTVRRMKRNPSIHLFGTWSNVLIDSNEIEREKLMHISIENDVRSFSTRPPHSQFLIVHRENEINSKFTKRIISAIARYRLSHESVSTCVKLKWPHVLASRAAAKLKKKVAKNKNYWIISPCIDKQNYCCRNGVCIKRESLKNQQSS